MRKARWLIVSALAGVAWTNSLAAQTESLRDRIVVNHFEYIPDGEGPFPTLIAIPGCSGIAFPDSVAEATSSELRDDDRLFRRHYPRAAERLRAEGFAVLLIHVHGAEGLVTACGGQIPPPRVAEYITEAVRWAPELAFVDRMRMHVIGWSMGGRGVLSWLSTPQSRATSVRSAIGVYAGCADQQALSTHVPLLLLLGGADDIADPRVCERLLAQSASTSLITAHVYPGARHGFDVAAAPPVLDIGNGMTIGYQREASDAAWQEILAFLH